ncbi:hypothetical protein Tco_0686906 [Tanacetum coccineum]
MKFNEFNYLLKVDPELFTYEVKRTKNYNDYMNKFNDKLEESWTEDGVLNEIGDHICEPFRFKNGETKWPTCSSNEDGFCNGGELPGMVRVGYMTYFQDHKWYNNLIDRSLKDEALEQKAIYEESWGNAKPSEVNDHKHSPFANWKDHIQGPYTNFFATHNPYLDISRIFDMNCDTSHHNDDHNMNEHEVEEICELFDDQELPVCNIRRFVMIKY